MASSRAVANGAGPAAVELEGLRVGIGAGDAIVEDVDLRVSRGEILGLVGESGSGKTTTALSLLGYSSPGLTISEGELRVGGRSLPMSEEMRADRGALISYVPQNPGRALNPSLRIIAALEEILSAHGRDTEDHAAALRLLDTVGLEAREQFGRRYPHQLSGGQQQRVCIAGALSCDPGVIVLDEPTTGLDVVTQARILSELLRLRDEQGVSIVYVSHDLAVVGQIADRIAVMYAGRIVEQGPTEQLLRRPRHPYTRGLLASIPDHVQPRVLEPMAGIAVGVGERPPGCSFAPRCPQRTERCVTAVPDLVPTDDSSAQLVRCVHWSETPAIESRARAAVVADSGVRGEAVLDVKGLSAVHRSRQETVVAARDVSFGVARGECVALVGESGSGKTTVARTIAGLHPIGGGEILFDGAPLPGGARARSIDQRRRIQMVFQNPADTLNPRQTVSEAVIRPARMLRRLSRADAKGEVRRLLEQVRLPARLADRYPSELSGGERQRVGIARALAADPDVILCDEVTSALDVSVQAAVLKLLEDLRADLGLALLFITHDLGVVATIADRVLVLESGIVCERGTTSDVLRTPKHPYTKRLLDAAPSLVAAARAGDE